MAPGCFWTLTVQLFTFALPIGGLYEHQQRASFAPWGDACRRNHGDRRRRKRPGVQIYQFRGGAASWFGTQILGVLITVCTLGICYPFAVVLIERWRAKNTYLHGRQLRFIGAGWGIFGLWIKWLLLSIITLGIYTFWVYPRLMQWKVENTVHA